MHLSVEFLRIWSAVNRRWSEGRRHLSSRIVILDQSRRCSTQKFVSSYLPVLATSRSPDIHRHCLCRRSTPHALISSVRRFRAVILILTVASLRQTSSSVTQFQDEWSSSSSSSSVTCSLSFVDDVQLWGPERRKQEWPIRDNNVALSLLIQILGPKDPRSV